MSPHKKNIALLTLVTLLLTGYTVSAQDSVVIHLWKNGAPGFENKKDEPEQAKDWWVKNIHNPSVTIYPASKENNSGTAILICPGGGFQNLVFNSEGVEVAKYFNSIGITAFILKYRLFRRDSVLYNPSHVKQDVFRAMRLVKSLAGQYAVDSNKIGVMGFSAGGEVAGWVSYHFTDKNYVNPDAIDQLSSKPAFQVLIYPGPLVVPDSVAFNSPSTFLLAANDDVCCSEPVVKLLQMHRQSKVPVEVHIYAKGNHAFNMGKRSTLLSIKAWPARMKEWLIDNGWLSIKN
ncbi:MAG: alpha/beta hydrolase [Sphingobacteriales bacterium]|nr:alpha/beta hydrolase [Sphingobacteriales bacterium]MBI3717600.1 alpha/beta hydrolase [Sphingobacteriales bacterium]